MLRYRDYPSWVDTVAEDAIFYNPQLANEFNSIDDKVWEVARQSVSIPHAGEIAFKIYMTYVINSIIEIENLNKEEVWEKVKLYPNASASQVVINGATLSDFDEMVETIKAI